jgi:hypothetical protein
MAQKTARAASSASRVVRAIDGGPGVMTETLTAKVMERLLDYNRKIQDNPKLQLHQNQIDKAAIVATNLTQSFIQNEEQRKEYTKARQLIFLDAADELVNRNMPVDEKGLHAMHKVALEAFDWDFRLYNATDEERAKIEADEMAIDKLKASPYVRRVKGDLLLIMATVNMGSVEGYPYTEDRKNEETGKLEKVELTKSIPSLSKHLRAFAEEQKDIAKLVSECRKIRSLVKGDGDEKEPKAVKTATVESQMRRWDKRFNRDSLIVLVNTIKEQGLPIAQQHGNEEAFQLAVSRFETAIKALLAPKGRQATSQERAKAIIQENLALAKGGKRVAKKAPAAAAEAKA